MLFEEFYASVLEFDWHCSPIWMMCQIRQQVLVLRQNTLSQTFTKQKLTVSKI